MDRYRSCVRVAFVIDRFHTGRGGLEAWLSALALHLAERGGEIHLVSGDRDLPSGPFAHHPLPPRGRSRAVRDRRFAEAARDFVRGAGFDVVVGLRHCLACDVYFPHGGSMPATLEARRRAKRLPLPLSRKARNLLSLERDLLEGAAPPRRVIAVSEMVRRDLAERYPGIADRITVVANGVDLHRFTPAGRDRDRERLVPEGGRTVLFLAGNPRLKGWRYAREAFSRLRSMGEADILLVAGCRPRGLPEGSRCLGRLSDPEAALRAADLLIHPTFHDPFPLVVLESLACGTPVATTERNGALDHVGRDGPVAAVGEPTDVEGLVRIGRDLLRAAPREEARRRAEGFPVQRSLERTVELLYGGGAIH